MPTNTAGDSGRLYQTHQLHYARKYFTFADRGLTLDIGTGPPGHCVVDAGVVVVEAFNAGTNNRLDIGNEDDTDDYGTDLSLLTKGKIVADELATSDNLYSATAKKFQCVVDVTGTTPTTGIGIAYVAYTVPDGLVGAS